MNRVVNVASGAALALAGLVLAWSASAERLRQSAVAFAAVDYEAAAADSTAAPKAEESLSGALEKDPGNAEASFRLGRLLQRKGETAKALLRMDAAISSNPFQGAAHYWRGRLLSERGAHGIAGTEMKLAGALARNQPDYMFRIGYFFFSRWKKTGDIGDLDESLGYFRKSAELELSNLNRTFDILREFALHYDTLMNVIPDTDEAHFEAGMYFGHGMGMWLFSLKEFEKAKGINSRNPAFALSYGLALLHNGRLEESRNLVIQGIENFGGAENRILDLEIHYRAAGKPEEGASVYRALAELYPQNPAPNVNLAKYMLAGAHARCAAGTAALDSERDRLLESTPPEKKEWARRTFDAKKKALFASEFAAVRDFLREASGRTPSATLYYYLADVESQLSNLAQAEAWILKAIEADSSWKGAWYWLISLLVQEERYDDALTRINDALSRFPGDPRLLKMKDSALDMKIRSGKKG